MIDKITITINDNGAWVMNAGDMAYGVYERIPDLLMNVKAHLDRLAWFPPEGLLLPVGPVAQSQLPVAQKRREKRETAAETKARTIAEKHLKTLLNGDD